MFNCFVGYVMGWNAFSTAPTGNSGVNRSGFGQFSEPDIAYGWWSAGAPFVVTPVKTFDPLNPNSSFGLANPSLLQSLTPSYYGGTSTNGDAYGQSGPKISCPTGQHPLPSIGSTFPLFTCVPNSTPNTTLTTVVSSTGTLTNTLATGFGTSSIGGTHPTGNTLLPTTPPGGVQIIVPCYLSFPGLPCSP